MYKHPFPSKKSFFQHKKFTSYIQSATHIIQTTSGQGEQAEVKSRYHCVQASGNLRICFGKSCRSCEAYQARILDVPLQKLLQSMSIAYRQNLTSPKWNRFKVRKSILKSLTLDIAFLMPIEKEKIFWTQVHFFFQGLRLRWKDKIRLNNVIWRCWHQQFVAPKHPQTHGTGAANQHLASAALPAPKASHQV